MSSARSAPARSLAPGGSGSAGASARRGFRLAFAAAIVWMAFGAESLIHPSPRDVRDAVWFLPWFLTLGVAWFVHRVQRDPAFAWERSAFAALAGSMIAVALGNVGLLAGIGALSALAFPLGALLWAATMAAYGVATWRRGVFPRSTAVAFALLEPASILAGLALSPWAPLHERGAYDGALAKGVATAMIAYGLRQVASRSASRARAPSPQPLARACDCGNRPAPGG